MRMISLSTNMNESIHDNEMTNTIHRYSIYGNDYIDYDVDSIENDCSLRFEEVLYPD